MKTSSLNNTNHVFYFQVNRIRSQHRINVHGSDIPDPVCTFDELQSEYHLNARILQNLRDAGLCSPTPIQMQAMPLMMHVSVEKRRFNGVYIYIYAVWRLFCEHFCVPIRVGSYWLVLPQDQERLWLSAFRCSPICSSLLILASELSSFLQPGN